VHIDLTCCTNPASNNDILTSEDEETTDFSYDHVRKLCMGVSRIESRN
jgi:hypothetical protein